LRTRCGDGGRRDNHGRESPDSQELKKVGHQ
jgi:hypothetical protein